MGRSFWVYIVTDEPYGTIYTGMTNDIARRAYEHREGLYPGFAKKYKLTKLVYCEEHATAIEAIAREKKIKKWTRDWKKQLIETINPTWRDLYDDINS
jgi:putative endonuclease